MNWRTHIERSPGVMLGKPVFRGTRLTVEHVLERLGDGATFDELLRSHPRLTLDHLQAAMAYSADALRADRILDVDHAEAT